MSLKLIFIFSLLLSLSAKASTPDSIMTEIINQNLAHADIVWRQAMYETGWLKAPGFTVNKNLFGLRSGGKLMKFATWPASITYYKTHIQKHWSGQDYYAFLNCMYIKKDGTCQRYATNPDYTNQLKKIPAKK